MQSGQIYTVSKVDALSSPFRYFLKEYDGTPAGWAYSAELKQAPDPHTHEYPFTILDSRKRNGKEEVLLKYLFYPNKLVFSYVFVILKFGLTVLCFFQV